MKPPLARNRPGALSLLVVSGLLLMPPLLALDPVTPLVFWAGSALLVLIWAVRPRRLWAAAVAGMALAAFWVFWSHLLYTRPQSGDPLLFGGLHTTAGTLERAALLALRSWATGCISLGMAFLVKAEDLVGALMQQGRLPVRFGFALWTALAALPRLVDTQRLVRSVHRLRAAGGSRPPLLAGPVALLAGVLRHADRAAVSLTERGLERFNPARQRPGEAKPVRTWLKPRPWTRWDTALVTAAGLTVSGLWLALAAAGLFRFGFY